VPLSAPRSRASIGVVSLALTIACTGALLVGCGGQSNAASVRRLRADKAATTTTKPRTPAPPALVVSPLRHVSTIWRPVAWVHGQVAVWEAQQTGVTMLRFAPRRVRLDLHAGAGEPSGTWHYGAEIGASEIHHVIAAFNGGFKFTTGDVGWMQAGRVAVPLRTGRGSIVTYTDGTTEIGAWNEGVPAAGKQVYSVLQNLSLLVDHGVVAGTAEGCVQSCWGATVGNVDSVARSALGITSTGELVWGAGEHLVPGALGQVLAGVGVQRAVQLDINPDWVAGYLYVHGHSGPSGTPVVPEQLGITGRFLEPYGRDFLAVVAR
jgi:hypothetical protein